MFAAKADLVPDKISQELEAHRQREGSDYGVWSMEAEEAEQVAEFLAANHEDRPERTTPSQNRAKPRKRTTPSQNRAKPRKRTAGAERSPKAACKHCGSKDLAAQWGKYGYYWKCGKCQKTTTMPAVCSACGAKKSQDNEVRVRKDATTYFRDCTACGKTEVIWTET